MNKKNLAFIVAIIMMVANVGKRLIDFAKSGSINFKSSKGGKNSNGSNNPRLHQPLIEKYWVRGSRNSHQLFMMTMIMGHPDIMYNKTDDIPKNKVNKGWKQIFVNMHMFVMVSSTFHQKVYVNWPGGGPLKTEALDAALAQSIHDGMAASSYFTGITGIAAILSAYASAVHDWIDMIVAVPTGTKQDKTDLAAYSEEMRTITTARLVEIVQGVVDSQRLNAQSIVEAAAMSLKGVGGKSDQLWTVERIAAGVVELIASVKEYKKKRYSIQWMMTLTPADSESWWSSANSIIPTPKGKTTVSGLVKGKEYFFRYRVSLTDGSVSDWSNTISLLMS